MADDQFDLPSVRKLPVVEAATVTKKTSLLILAFCLFSLAIFFASGFVLFNPYFAVLTGMASAIFYVMGVMIGRPARHIR